MHCRFCGREGLYKFADLGKQPLANALLNDVSREDKRYPLQVYVCDSCYLAQVPECATATQIFQDDYPYYSSQSPFNLQHAREYVNVLSRRFGIRPGKRVLEIGSNDGYLLRNFKERGIECLGIEPSTGPADVARSIGVPTIEEFWTKELVARIGKADLILGINVIAHVPDINDFVAGLGQALEPRGIVSFEFPHLMQLVDLCQFDTIYHEHFHYFSFSTLQEIFRRHGLEMFDVEEIPSHGGSLRIFAQHFDDGIRHPTSRMYNLLKLEADKGVYTLKYYEDFQERLSVFLMMVSDFLDKTVAGGKTVGFYGAAAKGITLLNCFPPEQPRRWSPYVADISEYKEGKYIPGCKLPIVNPALIKAMKPNYVFILPWNLKDGIMKQLEFIREWGGQFVVADGMTLEII